MAALFLDVVDSQRNGWYQHVDTPLPLLELIQVQIKTPQVKTHQQFLAGTSQLSLKQWVSWGQNILLFPTHVFHLTC